MIFKKIFISLVLLVISFCALAECVNLYGATSFTVPRPLSVILYRYGQPFVLIKTFSVISLGDDVQLLKTGFVCSAESGVFLLNGVELVNVNQITAI